MIKSFTNFLDMVRYTPSVIFDIGARDCAQSVEFSKKYPNAKIFAFEANPQTIPLCKTTIQNNPNIRLIEGAVHNYDGVTSFHPIDTQRTRTIWKDGNPGASSLFLANGSYPIETYVQNKIEIPCHRLDTICKQENISPDIIWMDLQGAELLALTSLGEYLNTCKYIFTEVSHKPIYEGQCMFSDIDCFLQTHGFKRESVVNPQCWQEDVIYSKY